MANTLEELMQLLKFGDYTNDAGAVLDPKVQALNKMMQMQGQDTTVPFYPNAPTQAVGPRGKVRQQSPIEREYQTQDMWDSSREGQQYQHDRSRGRAPKPEDTNKYFDNNNNDDGGADDSDAWDSNSKDVKAETEGEIKNVRDSVFSKEKPGSTGDPTLDKEIEREKQDIIDAMADPEQARRFKEVYGKTPQQAKQEMIDDGDWEDDNLY